jgi:thymidylate synthase (FAD)
MDLNTKIDYLNDFESYVSMVDRMVNDVALKVVNSARQSYGVKKQAFEEKDEKLCGFLWDKEHTSPFRHSYYTFNIRAPLFLFNQLKKYQVGSVFRSYEVNGDNIRLDLVDHFYDTDKGCSWNELSGRYKQTSDAAFIPDKLRSNPGHGNKQSSGEYVNPLSKDDPDYHSEIGMINRMCYITSDLFRNYQLMIKNGVAKEIARMFLPQNVYTEASWTVSLQAVMHFLHQRLDKDAQFEIRLLAEAIYTLVEPDLTKIGISREDLLTS